MRTVLLILLFAAGIFGRRHHAAPVAPQRSFGHWEYTPHINDGYWVKYTPHQMAERTGLKAWDGYPFDRWVWEWPGYKGEMTWIFEGPSKDQVPEKPEARKWIPDYDPYGPGQKYNL